LENGDDFGAAIDQVAEENGFTTGWWNDARRSGGVVAEFGEQIEELVVAAVDITDDIERAFVGFAIVPERLAFNGDLVGLFLGFEDVDMSEAFALQAAEAAAELDQLIADNVRTKGTVGAIFVAVVTSLFGEFEDDCDGQDIVLTGQSHERLTGLGLDIGGVDHSEKAAGKALGGDVVEHFESFHGGSLIVLVVADESTAEIGGKDFGWLEMRARESGLATATGADEDDKRKFGDGE
jgi:hypothetical protein